MRVNLNSDIWGAHGWFFCESICLGYPDKPTKEDKQQYKNFFYSFPYVIPCYKCRLHFSEYIKKYPLNDKILSLYKISMLIQKDICLFFLKNIKSWLLIYIKIYNEKPGLPNNS